MKLDSLEDCDCTDGSVSALSEKRPWKKISTPTATTLITFAATLLILLDKLFFFFLPITLNHTQLLLQLSYYFQTKFFFLPFTLNHTQLLLQLSYYFQTKFFFFTNHTQSHTTFATTLLLLSDKIFFFYHSHSITRRIMAKVIHFLCNKKKKKQAVKNSTIPTRLRVAYFEHDGAEWEVGGNVVSYGW